MKAEKKNYFNTLVELRPFEPGEDDVKGPEINRKNLMTTNAPNIMSLPINSKKFNCMGFQVHAVIM